MSLMIKQTTLNFQDLLEIKLIDNFTKRLQLSDHSKTSLSSGVSILFHFTYSQMIPFSIGDTSLAHPTDTETCTQNLHYCTEDFLNLGSMVPRSSSMGG